MSWSYLVPCYVCINEDYPVNVQPIFISTTLGQAVVEYMMTKTYNCMRLAWPSVPHTCGVLHVFHMCHTGVYPIHVLHMYLCICNAYYMCRIIYYMCIIGVLHMYYRCI